MSAALRNYWKRRLSDFAIPSGWELIRKPDLEKIGKNGQGRSKIGLQISVRKR